MTNAVYSLHEQLEEARRRVTILHTHAKEARLQREALDAALDELETFDQELRVAEEELLQSAEDLGTAYARVEALRKHYADLFELAPIGYLVTDMEGVVQETNQAAAQVLAKRPKSLIGKPLITFVPVGERRSFRSILLNYKTTDLAHEFELRLQPHNKTPFEAFVTVKKLSLGDGHPDLLQWLIHDATNLKRVEEERSGRREKAARLDEIARRERFVRDVLMSVTQGKLCLCYTPSDLPKILDNKEASIALKSVQETADLRHIIREIGAKYQFPMHRILDLETAVGEAAANAVVHGHGGEAAVYAAESRSLQVWITDRGEGISLDHLPRATLERGYTTAGTLGHGFWLLLQMVDRVWLLTGSTGTTVVIEQDPVAYEPVWP